MAYDYELWIKRAKQNGISPVWVALSTVIVAPLGYWFNGDGVKGLKYMVIIFFAGYLTLGVGTFIGAALLTYDVYQTASRHEQRFTAERPSVQYSGQGRLVKAAMSIFFLVFLGAMFFVAQLIENLGA